MKVRERRNRDENDRRVESTDKSIIHCNHDNE